MIEPVIIAAVLAACLLIGYFLDRELRWTHKLFYVPLIAVILYVMVITTFLAYDFWIKYGEIIMNGYFSSR